MTWNPNQPRVPAGSSGGGRWGSPRNTSAAKAQHNVKAVQSADHFRTLPAGKRTAYLKGLSDSDLEALTEVVYSHRTSDPAVVAMRITVANEMTRRGIDIKKYGALGGGLRSPRVASPAQKRALAKAVAAKSSASRSAAAARAASAARATSQVQSTFRTRAV